MNTMSDEEIEKRYKENFKIWIKKAFQRCEKIGVTLTGYGIPDLSCEIGKPMTYIEFISDYFGTLSNYNKDGSITIDKLTANTIDWMLGDASTVIYHINEALYGGEE